MKLDAATGEALNTEMVQRKLNGSWIVRDALEKRYGIETALETDATHRIVTDLSRAESTSATRGVDPEKAVRTAVTTVANALVMEVRGTVTHVPPSVATEIAVPAKVSSIELAAPVTNLTVARTTESNAPALPNTMPRTIGLIPTMSGIVVPETVAASPETNISTGPKVATAVGAMSGSASKTIGGTTKIRIISRDTGRGDGRPAGRSIRVRTTPTQNPKAVRLLAEARRQRERMDDDLSDIRLDRDRAVAEVVHLRAEVADLRDELESREAAHAVALSRRPRVVAGKSGHAYAIIPVTDASGKRTKLAQRIHGVRVT